MDFWVTGIIHLHPVNCPTTSELWPRFRVQQSEREELRAAQIPSIDVRVAAHKTMLISELKFFKSTITIPIVKKIKFGSRGHSTDNWGEDNRKVVQILHLVNSSDKNLYERIEEGNWRGAY